MNFKTFPIGINTEKLIMKTGFTVHSLEEVKTFCEEKEVQVNCVPKDYFFDGSIWEIVDISDYYERLLLLARVPLLPFKELWQLFLKGERDDSFGALVIIANMYFKELILELDLMCEKSTYDKIACNKLKTLKTNVWVVNNPDSRRIITAIDAILEKSRKK